MSNPLILVHTGRRRMSLKFAGDFFQKRFLRIKRLWRIQFLPDLLETLAITSVYLHKDMVTLGFLLNILQMDVNVP